MGRNKINDKDKKKKISVSVNPDIVIKLKEKSINVSSLINKLLLNYINNEKNM
jgi:post-segregation antitoxin (ccd killing protein)